MAVRQTKMTQNPYPIFANAVGAIPTKIPVARNWPRIEKEMPKERMGVGKISEAMRYCGGILVPQLGGWTGVGCELGKITIVESRQAELERLVLLDKANGMEWREKTMSG